MHSSISFSSKPSGLAFGVLAVMVSALATTHVRAHHPERETQPVHPRIDVIGPLGNHLPPSYRRVYNRPTYLGGKIAYHIAPSSQEAMAWHRAEHRGLYDGNCPRVEDHYFYPKPWEAMRIGQRRSVLPTDSQPASMEAYGLKGDEGMISDEASTPVERELTNTQDAPVRVQTVPVSSKAFLPTVTLAVELMEE